MKAYRQGILVGLFLLLGGFVIFQYQNCGSSSGTNTSAFVGPSGLSYSITLTPQTQNPVHPTNVMFTSQVQVSAADTLVVKMGYVQVSSGNQMLNLWCSSQSPGPVSSIAVPCDPYITQAGTYNLYVEVDDQYGMELRCTSNTQQGCNGTYTQVVQ